jgi:phosphate transport system substrate-binding protein
VTITNPKRLGALALVATFALSACSGGGSSPSAAASDAASEAPASPAESADASEGSGGAVSGSVLIAGSSTVEPVSTAVAEAFKAANPDFAYTITGEGTGDGFQRFCSGETDVSDASRQIRDEGEADVCAQNGVEYVELKIAVDGISVLTSHDNADVTCLSFPDLYALIGPESTGFGTWAAGQEIATALGSSTALPDDQLSIFGPGEESGTFDSFVELVLTDAAEARSIPEDQITTRPDYTASSNDNAIIEGISGSPTSLGWVGFAFYEENLDKVKALQVAEEANGTCVEPTAETIADNSYPISRDLYIYVNKAKAAENAAVAAFVDYYLADGTIDTALETVPYVPLTPEVLAETQAAWAAR